MDLPVYVLHMRVCVCVRAQMERRVCVCLRSLWPRSFVGVDFTVPSVSTHALQLNTATSLEFYSGVASILNMNQSKSPRRQMFPI